MNSIYKYFYTVIKIYISSYFGLILPSFNIIVE